MKRDAPAGPGRLILAATRIWLPLAIAAVGVVLIILGHASLSQQAAGDALESGSGVALLIVAIIVWMVNWMFRMSVQSNRDREVEEEAREYFDRHGHWPDERPE
jgi:ABC-type nickel/cobalt efflux system permease component RcnA